jgi:hypothetical protein
MLIGSVELHIKSSDWIQHKHSSDSNYRNIILHVVWQNDKDIFDANNIIIPTIELQPYVSTILLNRYEHLMLQQGFVACATQLPGITELAWASWKERLLVERLTRKSTAIITDLAKSKQHWEEVFWWHICSNFGMKVNADAFEQIARTISINTLAKHKNQIHQLEALLLGQAGLLQQSFEEDYPKLLQREYNFLSIKYHLSPINKTPHFLRMRPANFPTIRLAQLAMLIYQSVHLFSIVKDATDIHEVSTLLNTTANDYWHYHYRFDELTAYQPKKTGEQMINNIVINTIVPIIFAYGIFMKEEHFKTKALQWLMQVSAEENNITNNWKTLTIANNNAFDSQALIELKNTYCNNKKCLDCAIGNKILRSN